MSQPDQNQDRRIGREVALGMLFSLGLPASFALPLLLMPLTHGEAAQALLGWLRSLLPLAYLISFIWQALRSGRKGLLLGLAIGVALQILLLVGGCFALVAYFSSR